MDSLEEKQIIQDVLAGRTEAFAALVRAHQAKVLSLCLSLLRDRAEAEDAAQDVFLRAYRSLKDFRADSSFSTWIYRISYRRCLDLIKARKVRRAESLDALLAGGGEKAVETGRAEPEADDETLERILSALPPEYRMVLTFREVQGLAYDEIARATGASLDSVKARLRRARLALREAARHFLKESDV